MIITCVKEGIGNLEGHGQPSNGETLMQDHELDSCYRLRHSYFVESRGWVQVGTKEKSVESDQYDSYALHLGIWEGDKVATYLRVLPFIPEVGFMLDREFSAILSDQEKLELPRENAVELSRLVDRTCLSSAPSPRKHGPHNVELILKRLYQISIQQGFEIFYIVVEDGWLAPFKRRFGLPFRVLGRPHIFPDGTKTVAAVATRGELEAGMRAHSEEKYEWYCDGLMP